MHAMADTTSYERKAQAGRWLKQAHESRGMNSAELARRLNTTAANVSNWETGRYWVPDDVARQIAHVLGMTEVEVRHGLGLYVPGGITEEPSAGSELDTIAAIERDTRLIPEARRHLLNQYQLLLRIGGDEQPSSSGAAPPDPDTDADVLQLPRVARKSPKPRKRPT